MLISHRKKFIYTKTVKTAGTSVESYFEKYCMPEGEWKFSHAREEYVSDAGIIGYRGSNPGGATWYNHMPAKEIKTLIGDQIWDNYFKFCIVRNPFDKLISGFHHMSRERNNDCTLKNKLLASFKRLLNIGSPLDGVTDRNKIDRFRSWIKNGGMIIDRDKYIIDSTECMDFFILYEDMQTGVKEVCNYLDIPFEADNIPTLKSGSRLGDHPIAKYYDFDTIQTVTQIYEYELNRFNYKPPKF